METCGDFGQTPARSAGAWFTPALFAFLDELRNNNERAWFEANRPRYESAVRQPMLRFIAALGPRMEAISSVIEADPRPVGGSMFRIYRDTRFSHDKRPFKTAAGAQFRHRAGKDVHAPGFYLHLEPSAAMGAGGIWHPSPAGAGQIRAAILAKSEQWQSAISAPGLMAAFALGGESLKRPPRGIDPAHPLIEDLKRKDFFVTTPYDEDTVCRPDFLDRYVADCRTAAPLVAFLSQALGLPW